MPAIKITGFGGMQPAVDTRLLPDNAASHAENVWLYEGNLSGFKTPALVRALTNGSAKKTFRIPNDFLEETNFTNSLYLEFTDLTVDVVRAPMLQDSYSRYYWAGKDTAPSYNTLTRIQTAAAALTLGVPQPTTAPTVTEATTAADTTAPVAASMVVNATIITVTFTEARRLDSVAPPRAAFRVFTEAGDYTVARVLVDGDNNKVILELNVPIPTGQTTRVVYTQPSTGTGIQDNSGNAAVSFTLTSADASTDYEAPVFGWADVVDQYLYVTFTDASALSGTGIPSTTAWTVFVNGVQRTVSNVALNTTLKAFTLTLASAVDPGDSVRLNYTNPNSSLSVQDTWGNKTASFSDAPVNNFSALFAAGSFGISSATVLDNILTLKFNRDLDASMVVSTARFTVTVAGATRTVSAVSINSTARTVTLQLASAVVFNQVVSVTYTDVTGGDDLTGVIQDTDGNDSPAFTSFSVLNTTPSGISAPVVTDAWIVGTALYLQMDQPIDAGNLPASARFTITANGSGKTISTISAYQPDTYLITLSVAVTAGQVVLITYTDTTVNDDTTNVIQSAAGLDAASFSSILVTNNT